MFSDIENEIGKKMLLDDENSNIDENKKRKKKRNALVECSGNHNVSHALNIIADSEIQNYSGDEIFEQELSNLTANQKSAFIKNFRKKIRIAMQNLKGFKPYPEEFLKSIINDKSCYSSLSDCLKKLNEISKYIQKLNDNLVPKIKTIIERSMDNRNIFIGFLKLISYARSAHNFF